MRLLIVLLVFLSLIAFTVTCFGQQRTFTEVKYFATPDDSVWTFKGYRTIVIEPVDTGTYTYTLLRKKIIWAVEPVTIHAASFVQQSGVIVAGNTLGGVDRNDWLRYQVNLFGRTSIDYEYAMSDQQSGAVEFRIGSTTAPPVAKMVLPPTGGWSNFVTMTIPITGATAEGDLYVTFTESSRATGSGGNIRKLVIR